MSPTQATETPNAATTKPSPARTFSPVTRTVFDLATFDDVKLTKDFKAPTQPTSLEEALALVSNDSQKLLDLIYEGLVAEARNAQYADIAGFKLMNESGDATTEYTGKFADETRGKSINLMILNMAKAFSGGSWDSLPKEKKGELKDSAIKMVRENPAMLAMVTG